MLFHESEENKEPTEAAPIAPHKTTPPNISVVTDPSAFTFEE